jgi:uncharacterized Zn finger protein (UPF0148 family)
MVTSVVGRDKRELMNKDATVCPHCRERRTLETTEGAKAPSNPKPPPPSRPRTAKEQIEELRAKVRLKAQGEQAKDSLS